MGRTAGWYQDPLDPTRERRWDGTGWSDDARPAQTPPVPAEPLSPGLLTVAAPRPETAVPGPPVATAGERAWRGSPGPDAEGVGDAGEDAPPPPRTRGSRPPAIAWVGALGAVAAVVLLGGRLLAPGDDDGAVVSAGMTVLDEATATGAVGPNERAEIALEVTESGQVTLDLLGLDGLDPILRLSRDGDVLVVNDDGPSGLDSQVSEALDPGTYLVEAAGLGGQAGRFELRVAGPARLAP
ncbi:DUF2510 domain-containing protein [Nitriliruptoraceae bacterium ZYF776]|nr:DUF2510 domain-containing protein [Profundirhabdus halotolerans]